MPGQAAGRVAIIGGGPAGVFLARMLAITRPGTRIDVYDRGGPDDAPGFGVALSDRTMHGLSLHDPTTARRIEAASATISGLRLCPPGASLRYDGFGVRAISRHTLLTILREQATAAGARLHFHRTVRAGHADLDADVVAFADGAHSTHRGGAGGAFGTSLRAGSARYVWLGTSASFDRTTVMAFVRTRYGPMAAHCYPYGEGQSTVVVETDDATWRRAGLATSSPIGTDALDLLGEVFADTLGGHPLVSNASRWGTFTVVRNERWSHANTVLVGDAAHTAHFTVGSGTKMALEDGIGLAAALCGYDDRATAFAAYERDRRGEVERTQRWAGPSMRWWETFGRRLHLPPAQFGLHFLTRTPAVGYLGLRRRCPDRVDEAEAAYLRAAGADPGPAPTNAVAAPLWVGPSRLANRLVTVMRDGGPPLHSGLIGIRPADRSWSDGGPYLSFVELWGSDPDTAGDELVQRAHWWRGRGAAGVLVRVPGDAWSRWHETLEYAGRIRTEAGLPVAVCVPVDWAYRRPGEGSTGGAGGDQRGDLDRDDWPARIHLALISGRVDLVAASPCA